MEAYLWLRDNESYLFLWDALLLTLRSIGLQLLLQKKNTPILWGSILSIFLSHCLPILRPVLVNDDHSKHWGGNKPLLFLLLILWASSPYKHNKKHFMPCVWRFWYIQDIMYWFGSLGIFGLRNRSVKSILVIFSSRLTISGREYSHCHADFMLTA